MIGPQIILWSFLIVLPINAFVWSFLLVYPWRYFRQYIIGHIAAVFVYFLLLRLLIHPETELESERFAFWLIVTGYGHCLAGTLVSFFIRKKYLRYV